MSGSAVVAGVGKQEQALHISGSSECSDRAIVMFRWNLFVGGVTFPVSSLRDDVTSIAVEVAAMSSRGNIVPAEAWMRDVAGETVAEAQNTGQSDKHLHFLVA
ncbi:unnamed protein product [Arctia plantaginis]|uniref:Uncharacterized protein n=1 Tax=Arctia plantaginis TaxID=874455 RepID=A0A8S1AKT9_ARCPL|nr:unnamed protein product [Arctia plantaginis]